MLGSTALTAVLGSGVDNRDHEAVRAFVRSAADIGLALLFIYPDSKVPADLRTPAKKKADDKAAAEAAREAGRRDWATVKSPAGLALATNDKATLDRYLKRYIEVFSTWEFYDAHADGPTGEKTNYSKKQFDAGEIVMTEPAAVNLAVEVGASGLIVIDCDTAAQMERFYQVALSEDFPVEDRPAPTVITPGHMGADADPDDSSTWSHSDGGHFYFTVPDELMPTLPRNLGAMTWGGEDGFAVLWDRRYVLIPPSTRPEGRYEMLGRDYPVTDAPWLIDTIKEAAARRLERAERRTNGEDSGELATAIDQWAETISWTDILEPLGWSPAPRADSCGCPVWTGPGNHASPKSATAHDTGCTAGRYTEVNAPLHIWTDNPDPPFDTWVAEHNTKTISKLQAVALIHFDGGVGRAMDELGLTPDLAVDPDIDTKQSDPDHGMTGDGDFELPTEVEISFSSEPMPAPETDLVIADRSEVPDPDLMDADWCVPCQSAEGLFVRDPDDEAILWHAVDEDDAAETGGHRADGTITDPRTGQPIEQTSEKVVAAEETDVAAANEDGSRSEDSKRADISLDPADLPADFGKKTKESPYAGVDPEQIDPDVFDSKHQGVPRIAPFSHWRDMPPPEYIIEGLIEHGGLSCVIGPPGVGKSTVVLDMACHIATGKRWRGRTTRKTKVLYLPGEGLSGAVQRLRAWEAAHGLDVGRDLLLGNGIILVQATNEAWGELAAYIARQEIGLVIFDTFARMSSGLEENSATDVGRAVRRYDKLKELTNAGVCVVHHTGKGNPDVGRGSSALNGALDSELLVRPAQWDTSQVADDDGRLPGKPIELWTTKQKNAEQLDEAVPLMMIDFSGLDAPLLDGIEPVRGLIKAPVITGPNGHIDPMQGEIVLARPRPEPIVETSIRVRAYLDNLPEQGATRAELYVAIKPDAYALSRKDTPVYWKQRMAEAVDRGLRYKLIETLTGTPSGARYIPTNPEDGGATPDQARAAAAAEITDAE